MGAPLRSLLFVPGDSERKIEKSSQSNADAIVFDLEDSVAPGRKAEAREFVAAHLAGDTFNRSVQQWVRINPVSTPEALKDLAAIIRVKPAGILVPKAQNPAEVQRVSYYLDALEAQHALPIGSIKIIPVATETAKAVLSLHQYEGVELSRLYGLTWGAEDLSADVGAATNKDDDGRLSLTYRTARSLMLLAAKACAVEAVDGVFPDFKDIDGLKAACRAARREGFSGAFAVHPAQIDIINDAYSPSDEDIAHAERIIAAFAAEPDAGVVGLNGKMLDRPHLTQAQKILAMRDAFASRR
jgi:citrate lyase subunit beta / citryl-CoA lyase